MQDPSLDAAIRAVGAGAVGVSAVYLFGSVAAGRTHRESDLDLAVLLDWTSYPSARDRFEARLRLIGEFSAALGRNDIDLVVLNDAPPVFAREIVTRGRRVFVGDADAEHAFRRDAMRRAADIEPWLRRVRRLKLERLTG
jgi:predicted nucleotidyltransferase